MHCQKLLLGFLLVLVAFAAWPTPSQSQQQLNCNDVIRLTHYKTKAHLHSHCINYSHPGSSGQQQITAYLDTDYNDLWSIRPPCAGPVRDGNIIKLEHVTEKYLHSHPIDGRHITAPVNTTQQEVTGFGGDESDPNNLWRVEVEGGGNWTTNKRVKLIHVATNAALHSHSTPFPGLPRQQEVTAYPGRDDNDWWQVLPDDHQLSLPRAYIFRLDNFEIQKTRSRHEDTVFVSAALKVGDSVWDAKPSPKGDLNDGQYDVGITFGPITINSPTTPVSFSYVIVNSGHGQDWGETLACLHREAAAKAIEAKFGLPVPQELVLNTGNPITDYLLSSSF